MSNTQIKARSGSDWTETELTAFNIQVDTVVAPAFFNTTQLPDNHVSPVIIATERLPQRTLAKSDRLFFQHMEDAMSGEDSAVVDFVAILLGMLQYDEEPYRIIRKWKESSFTMCGITVDAKPSVCVLTGDSEYLLLVQEAKSGTLNPNREPQLIAGAIAAFYHNNLRREAAGLPTIISQTLPCIIMVNTAPIFYRIPVTMDLVQCVQAGKYPSNTTIVQRCIPPVPNPSRYSQDGLVPLANRDIVLQCFQAFKAFLGQERTGE